MTHRLAHTVNASKRKLVGNALRLKAVRTGCLEIPWGAGVSRVKLVRHHEVVVGAALTIPVVVDAAIR